MIFLNQWTSKCVNPSKSPFQKFDPETILSLLIGKSKYKMEKKIYIHECIVKYNKYINGVDYADQYLSCYHFCENQSNGQSKFSRFLYFVLISTLILYIVKSIQTLIHSFINI